MTSMEDTIASFIVFLIVSVLMCIVMWFVWLVASSDLRRMRKYTDVHIGMRENDMLEIIGGGYSVSSLKDGVTKYEWRLNSHSYTSYRNGSAHTMHTGVRKLDIYVKNGFVREIRPYNI